MLLLVTDHGFLNELDHVWETLEDIDGGGSFIDGQFRWSSHSKSQERREVASKCCTTEHVDDMPISIGTAEQKIDGPDLEYVIKNDPRDLNFD